MGRMDGYRHVYAQEVAFRDLDVFGHVNNAVYLTYIENARIGYARQVLGIESLEGLLLIVASVKVDFRSRANLGETLEIGSRTTRVGKKSFDLEHEIRSQDGRLVAEVSTTLVAFDYDADTTMPVPPDWRERIENYESRSAAAT
jgi:acyl-CoA thioester hydrolase